MTEEQALVFFNALFAPYAEEDSLRLEVRPLQPAWKREVIYPDGHPPHNWRSRTPWGTREWFRLAPRGISGAAAHCARMATFYDVYFGVLPRQGRSGTQSDVSFAAWIWSDVDGGTDGVPGAVRIVRESHLPLPHIAVISGGGLHCYWRLTTVVELRDVEAHQTFKNVLKRLCMRIGGQSTGAHADWSRADTASILRVPGTYNLKRQNEPRPVRLARFQPDAERQSLMWWRANLPAMPAPPKAIAAVPAHLDVAHADGLLLWAQTPYPEGNRHKDLAGAAAWLIRSVRLTKPQAEELLLMRARVSVGLRAITHDEIRSIIEWA